MAAVCTTAISKNYIVTDMLPAGVSRVRGCIKGVWKELAKG